MNGDEIDKPIDMVKLAGDLSGFKAPVESGKPNFEYFKSPEQVAEEAADVIDFGTGDETEADPFERAAEHTGDKSNFTYNEAWKDGHEAGGLDGYERALLEALALVQICMHNKLGLTDLKYDINSKLKEIGRPVEGKA